MVFELLDERIRKVLRDRNIHEPTGPQRDTIPRVLEGKHVLLVAPTGIGKTEAAMLPVLHKLINTEGKGIRCIYVTPLRALNRDMLKRLEEFGEALDLRVAVRHGDTPQSERQKQSKFAPDILITTPETLQIMFTGRNLRAHLKNVRYFVVDEIHELTDDERGAQLSIAMERLVDLAGEYQRIGLSATVGSVPEVAHYLAGADRQVTIVKAQVSKQMELSVQCPAVTDVDRDLAGTLQSDPQLISCMRRCRDIIEAHRSTLLFVNTRDTAEALAARYHVWDENFKVGVHHGSLSKEIRIEMEEDFKAERLRGLICTSSLELGIDIGSADFAIQYNSPRQVARLIQRMGRAGHHVGAKAEGAIIASNPDEIAESLVIVRKSLHEELEPIRVRPNPMTVLANQLVAMSMVGAVKKDEAYRTICRSYPFQDLQRKDFDDVLDLVARIGLVFINEGEYKKSARGRKYFYDNISMIPDERTYLVRDLGTRAIVGTLDESFVVSFAEPYATFITRGRSWRIVEVREDELLVEQVKDIGSIPSWVGEDIPVPYSVAQEVGRLRREPHYEKYKGDGQAVQELSKYMKEQADSGAVPTDRMITLELGKKLAILNVCFGTKVNETIAKVLSTLLSARLGESVGVTTDPYRIILDLPRDIKPDTIIDTLRSIRSTTIESLVRMVIRNSSHLRWRFVYVAKKFGAVEKEADYRNINFSRLIEAYEKSAMFEEAVSKVLWEDLDMESTIDVVKRIESGELEFKVCGLSPIGRAGLAHSKELITPQRADHSILMALKRRLEEELMFLSCLNCGFQFRERPKDAPSKPTCPQCNGRMLAALYSYNRDVIKLLKKTKRSEDEEKELRKLYKNASLISTNGRKAMLAMAGRGIGPDTAGRILASFHQDEDDFLRDILVAEINYAKTKRFWD
ncbi:MAG: putative ski2-type helicase [Methanomassiliicoccales archaeon PtaU1.Bin124]|nr:MAG: putative ski2-type helicase [Methanomassiliicoccales archaeon PtaU1.Bin124]